jgi:arabinosaccharide transport system permease protein
VIAPFVVSPFVVFFFRQYAIGIPKDFIDAARVDGMSEFGIYLRIMAPLMAPAFAAMAILQARQTWNDFFWPLIVLRSNKNLTLQIGLASLLTPYGSNYDHRSFHFLSTVLYFRVIGRWAEGLTETKR